MTKGIGNVEYIRQGSEVAVQGQFAQQWRFLYTASTTKHERYNIGDRVVTPDGRVFRYSIAGTGGVVPGLGAAQGNKVNISASAPAQVAPTSPVLTGLTLSAGAIGDSAVTVTVGASSGVNADGAVLADAMRGGYIIIGDDAYTTVQNRGILGNDAVAAGGGTMNVYLDSPLIKAVVPGTTYIEVFPNPYSNMILGGGSNIGLISFLGIPAAPATVGQYFWLQTWGPTWITPGGGWTAAEQYATNDRNVYFVGDGSVNGWNASALGANTPGYQKAGFVMEFTASNSGGPPMIMLQISV